MSDFRHELGWPRSRRVRRVRQVSPIRPTAKLSTSRLNTAIADMRRATCYCQVARDRSIERSNTLVDPKLIRRRTPMSGESFSDPRRGYESRPFSARAKKMLGEEGAG